MKIICVGQNYVEHIKELGGETPEKPVVFLKPDTALLKKGQAFYLPDFTNDLHYEAEVILKICREGKHIQEKFSHKYYDQIGLGIDFTARDLQKEFRKKGLPWTLAKGFDGAAPVSDLLPVKDFPDTGNISFSLKMNGKEKQKGNTADMLFSFDKLISYISSFITLKKGDIIFTGTPVGVGKVNIGDKLEGFIEEKKLLEVNIK